MTHDLAIETVDLKSIIRAPVNPRAHPLENIAVIESSLTMFGQVEPLVVRQGNREIIAGNGRHLVMERLGWTECRVCFIDCDDTQAAMLAVVLNRSSELGLWNNETLLSMIHEFQAQGIDCVDIGWSDKDIAALANVAPPAFESQDANDFMGASIKVTAEQRAIFDAAAAKFRTDEADPTISDGRIVELLSADWLSR